MVRVRHFVQILFVLYSVADKIKYGIRLHTLLLIRLLGALLSALSMPLGSSTLAETTVRVR
jgi:hypothetical protein